MTSQKKSLFIIIAVICVVFLIVVKMVWFNSVLVGEKTHDFGFVEVTPPTHGTEPYICVEK